MGSMSLGVGLSLFLIVLPIVIGLPRYLLLLFAIAFKSDIYGQTNKEKETSNDMT